MKKSIFLICLLGLLVSCKKEPYEPLLLFNKITIKSKVNNYVTSQQILNNIYGDKEGYTLKGIIIDRYDLARVNGVKPHFNIQLIKSGSFTAVLKLEHPDYADVVIPNAQIEWKYPNSTLSFKKMIRNYKSDEITYNEILANVQGDKDGYRIKSIRIWDDDIAEVKGSWGYLSIKLKKQGTFRANIVLSRYKYHMSRYKYDNDINDITIKNAEFEYYYEVPNLTFERFVRENNSRDITAAEILSNVRGNKSGYMVKSIELSDNDMAEVRGEKPHLRIKLKKTGNFTANLVLEHPRYNDITINNAEFEISDIYTTTDITTVVSKTGRVWMDKNLGAERVATATDDTNAYGDYYQWGRMSDGHQKYNSLVYTYKWYSTYDSYYYGKFVKGRHSWYRISWNDNLWSGRFGHTSNGGLNNPCPKNFRVPTKQEWTNEIATWNSTISDIRQRAFNSVLKLPASGYRDYKDADLEDRGLEGYYWSSTHKYLSKKAYHLYFKDDEINSDDYSFPYKRIFNQVY